MKSFFIYLHGHRFYKRNLVLFFLLLKFIFNKFKKNPKKPNNNNNKLINKNSNLIIYHLIIKITFSRLIWVFTVVWVLNYRQGYFKGPSYLVFQNVFRKISATCQNLSVIFIHMTRDDIDNLTLCLPRVLYTIT